MSLAEATAAPRAVAFTAARIARRCDELAAALAGATAEPPLLVALPDGERLAAALTRRLGWPAARPLATADELPVAGRHLLVVAGVVDTGLTLRGALVGLAGRGAVDVEACVLLDRPHRRLVDALPIRHAGFRAPDRLLVGFGVAHRGRWAELPDVRVLPTS